MQQSWLGADAARTRALTILKFVDNPALFGNDPVGKLGNSVGMMYRFGGIDPQGPAGSLTGTRKLDLNNCNSVEASVIDTALFQFGAATCAAGFNSQSAQDQEINQRVRNILNRTRWNELVDAQTGQLQLGWKPVKDTRKGSYFATPASFDGFWASHDEQGQRPLLIDYWTDEGGLAAILAAGSETTPTGARPWYAMLRTFGKGSGKDVVVSYPGAWFTYSFMTATYLEPNKGSDFGATRVNWTKNAVDAFNDYQSATPYALPDAVELPDATYLAQGHTDLSVAQDARFTGTHTMVLAIGVRAGQSDRHACADRVEKLSAEAPRTVGSNVRFTGWLSPESDGVSNDDGVSDDAHRWSLGTTASLSAQQRRCVAGAAKLFGGWHYLENCQSTSGHQAWA